MNKHHHDSSDDEQMTDKVFKDYSKELVNELITSVNNDQVEGIYDNIINYEYGNVKKKGMVELDTMKVLREKYNFDK